jgi:hypothetical protein
MEPAYQSGEAASLSRMFADGRLQPPSAQNRLRIIWTAFEGGRVLVRRETLADVETIRAVTAAAFAGPGDPVRIPSEVALVDELRAGTAWLPSLSLVAVTLDGVLVGHVLCTRGRVEAAPCSRSGR